MATSYKEYKKIITQRAKKLRNNPTKSEAVLWVHLRRRNILNLKFLRQHPILHLQNNTVQFFIADFYCHQHKLIIEVDGDIHNLPEQKQHDQMRTDTLEELGYTILRFQNDEVEKDIPNVLNTIKKVSFK